MKVRSYDGLILVALFLLLAFVSVCVPPAHATQPARWSTDAHALARICWSERDARVDTDDCGMIYDVHATQARMRNQTLSQRLERYAHHSSPGQARRYRSWVPFLRLDLQEPDRWPQSRRWSRVGRDGINPQQAWEQTLDEAQRLVVGTQLSPCVAPVFHWGGPRVDRVRIERGIARGFWHPVDCGTTLNTPLGPGRDPDRADPLEGITFVSMHE